MVKIVMLVFRNQNLSFLWFEGILGQPLGRISRLPEQPNMLALALITLHSNTPYSQEKFIQLKTV